MAKKKANYYIPIGTGVVAKFNLSKDIYDSLAGDLGLLKEKPANTRELPYASASTYGIPKLRVTYVKSGTGDNEVLASGTLLCSVEKTDDFLKNATTKEYKGKKILRAYTARKRIFV